MEYINQILEWLKEISDFKLIGLLVFVLVVLYLFRKTFKDWLRKKLNLYTEEELKDFASFTKTEMKPNSNIDSDFKIWKK